jgi:hypothetical protein
VALDPDTIHRMVPDDGTNVRVTFEDGEQMTLEGKLGELVEKINGSVIPGIPDGIEHLG